MGLLQFFYGSFHSKRGEENLEYEGIELLWYSKQYKLHHWIENNCLKLPEDCVYSDNLGYFVSYQNLFDLQKYVTQKHIKQDLQKLIQSGAISFYYNYSL